MINPVKETILKNEVRIVNCMELMVSNQNKLITMMSTAGMQHIPPLPF